MKVFVGAGDERIGGRGRIDLVEQRMSIARVVEAPRSSRPTDGRASAAKAKPAEIFLPGEQAVGAGELAKLGVGVLLLAECGEDAAFPVATFPALLAAQVATFSKNGSTCTMMPGR